MRVKRELDATRAHQIKGMTSKELADRCPDTRVVFPSSPCVNGGCSYAINEPLYMNCTFVAAEAGGAHTLEKIGEMIGVTREGVRVIESRALRKIREHLKELENHASSIRKQSPPPGSNNDSSDNEGDECQDERDGFPAIGRGELVQLGR